MGFDIATMAQDAAGQVVGAGLGMATAGWQDRRQRKQAKRLQDIHIKGQKEMGEFNYGKQKQFWDETNYGAQMAHIKGAGLNPALIYGQSGTGGSTIGGPAGGVSASSAAGGSGEVGQMMGIQMQRELLRAQKENIEADTKNKLVDAENKGEGGVVRDNIAADTENKILNSVILEYTGKETKDQYERIKRPNRGIEEKAYQQELEARQGIAGTIYELYLDGTLKNKTVQEVEGMLLKNAKTREETRKIYKDMELLEENIKGAKLDNIIKDLETKLQMETGIDSKSPTWLKILGRLFVNLFNK